MLHVLLEPAAHHQHASLLGKHRERASFLKYRALLAAPGGVGPACIVVRSHNKEGVLGQVVGEDDCRLVISAKDRGLISVLPNGHCVRQILVRHQVVGQPGCGDLTNPALQGLATERHHLLQMGHVVITGEVDARRETELAEPGTEVEAPPPTKSNPSMHGRN